MNALRLTLALAAATCLTVVIVTGRVNGVALLGVIAAGVLACTFQQVRDLLVEIVSDETPEEMSRLDRLDGLGCDCPNAHVEARL